MFTPEPTARGALTRRDWLLRASAIGALAACQPPPPQSIGGRFVGTDPARGHALAGPGHRAGTTGPGPVRRVHTVVVGAGVAGLAAAYALRQAGVQDLVVLELQDQAGGNSRSTTLAGQRCPTGAHYLPLPGDHAPEVQALLESLGLRRREAGRWVWDERHLCHSPQERLFLQGQWHEGLLPLADASPATLEQYRRFSQHIEGLRRQAPFVLPAARRTLPAEHRRLDALPLSRWLGGLGLDDPWLHWYLDYCCRDEYGAGVDTVSAWAGVHYFASRHGFTAPGAADEAHEPVLTWPEGNAWLTDRLAHGLDGRLLTGQRVQRVDATGREVAVDSQDLTQGLVTRWLARRVIVAIPALVAARVCAPAPDWLRQTATVLTSSAWMVANLAIRAPLHDPPGAAPAWDNVLFGSPGLGYVDAQHQSLRRVPGPTVLTYYQALGDEPAARRALLTQPWEHWRDSVLADLAPAHPDLRDKTTRIDISRHGHAMAVPRPGLLGRLADTPAWQARPRGQGDFPSYPVPQQGPLLFAHSDWSGYSIFEEAYTRGFHAGLLSASA